MSGPWQSSKDNEPRSLDPVSRRRAGRFVLHLLVLTVLIIMPYLSQEQSLREGMGVLSLAFGFGGMVSVLFAAIRGEPFAKGSLNGWDEALVFVAASRIVHAVMQLQA